MMPSVEIDYKQMIEFVVIGNNEKFRCTRCGKTYQRRETASRHVRLECGQVPKFVCFVCSQRFKRKEHLTSHIRIKHKEHFVCLLLLLKNLILQ